MEDPDLNAFANTYLIDDGSHGAVLKFDGPPHLRKKKPHKVSYTSTRDTYTSSVFLQHKQDHCPFHRS